MSLRHLITITIPVLIAFASASHAQEQRRQGIEGSIFIEASHVANATLTPVVADQVDEVQTDVGLSLLAYYNAPWYEVDFNYELFQATFSEDTQPEDIFWVGESRFELGKETDNFGLIVNHSVNQVLREPEDEFLLVNTSQRQILTVAPRVSARVDAGTYVNLVGVSTVVNYRDASENDTERSGVQLEFRRQLNHTQFYGVTYSSMDVDFINSDLALGYTRTDFSLLFERTTRSAEIVLEAGVADIEADDAASVSDDVFRYNLEYNYEFGGNVLTIFTRNDVTDSSLGNSNDPFLADEFNENGNVGVLDQYETQSVGAEYRTSSVCRRCDLTVGFYREEDSYFNQPSSDLIRQLMLTTLLFSINSGWDLRSTLQLNSSEFLDEDGFDDFDELRFNNAFIYQFRTFELELIYEHIDRDRTIDAYQVDRFGLGVSFNF